MMYTNLKDSPEFVQKTLNLIEESFGYDNANSFKIDFYPLFNKSNFKNCHILVDNNNVVAHIGQLTKSITIGEATYDLSMYGGISVNSQYRGKGIFKEFFRTIKDKYTNYALHLLWSDKIELYKKFKFYPCIGMYEYPKNQNNYPLSDLKIERSDLKNLSEKELKIIEQIYSHNDEIRINRNNMNWNEIKNISSAQLFLIKRNSQIENYFFINKGADLDGVIHEYGHINIEYQKVLSNYGKVWASTKMTDSAQPLFAALCSPGEKDLFNLFVKSLCGIQISSLSQKEVKFKFLDSLYTQPVNEFLIGILGPNRYKELNDSKKLFISGLDSI